MTQTSGRIIVHFEGAIATDHSISMRMLGKTLIHLQSSIDRAYLDLKHENIWKYARMPRSEYSEVLFKTSVPEEGGYILDFIGQNDFTKSIIDRINAALRSPIEEAMKEGEKIVTNLDAVIDTRKRRLLSQNHLKLLTSQDLIENPPEEIVRKYGDRSIVKEYDQIGGLLRNESSENSSIEIIMTGDRTNTYKFDKKISQRLHDIVAQKSIGDPVIYQAKVLELSAKNFTGKIKNIYSKKDSKIHLSGKEDFFKLRPHLGEDHAINIIACPLIEYGTFDPRAGDIYFIDLLSEDG